MDLFLQSNKTYRPINQLDWGTECSNEIYKRNVVLRVENDLDKLFNSINFGWQLIPGIDKWIIRSPEVSLYDLSEVYKNPIYDPIQLYAYYRYLKENDLNEIIKRNLKKKVNNNLKYLILKSEPYFESCCRIAGSDKRIKHLPEMIFQDFKNSGDWSRRRKESENQLKPRKFEIFYKNFHECSCDTKKFLNHILNKYKQIGRIVNLTETKINFGFWKNIPKYDNYFFVPTRGFFYLCGFLDETKKYENIGLFEYHTSSHENKELIWRNFEMKKNSRLVVIDVVYSGKTINYIKQEIKKMFKDAQIDIIGLFPKSRQAFPYLNYVVILDKIIKTQDINYSKSNFFEQTFINIINNNSLKRWN